MIQASSNGREVTIMKLTVIKKASPKKKPSNYCPWLIENTPEETK